jgi:tetratricopeptide (TPR) repeat protein
MDNRYTKGYSKQIFISYAWKDETFVDLVDDMFKSYGLTLIRDKRDLADMGNIKEFMKRVKTSDYVIMVISRAYVQSKNCMYEVLEFLQSDKVEERVLPIVIDNLGLSTITGKKKIVDYWKDLFHQERKEAFSTFDPTMRMESIRKDLIEIEKIYRSIDDFFPLIVERKYWNEQEVKEQKLLNVLRYIGFNVDLVLERVADLHDIKNSEERELSLENLMMEHPKNFNVSFAAGYFNQISNKYDKAIHYYEKALTYGQNAQVNFNLGLINLTRGNFEDAQSYFSNALKISPNYLDAHLCLGKSYVLDNKIDEAIELFESLVDLYFGSPEPKLELIDIYLAMGRNKKAQTLVNHLELIFSENADVGLRLIKIYQKHGENSRAIEILKRWESTSSNSAVFFEIKRELEVRISEEIALTKTLNNSEDTIDVISTFKGIVSLYPSKSVSDSELKREENQSIKFGFVEKGVPSGSFTEGQNFKMYCSPDEILFLGNELFTYYSNGVLNTFEIISDGPYRFEKYLVNDGDKVELGEPICRLNRISNESLTKEFVKIKFERASCGIVSIFPVDIGCDNGVEDNDPVINWVEKTSDVNLRTYLIKGQPVFPNTIIALTTSISVDEVTTNGGIYFFEGYCVNHGDILSYGQSICQLSKVERHDYDKLGYVEILSQFFGTVSLFAGALIGATSADIITEHYDSSRDCENVIEKGLNLLLKKKFCSPGQIIECGDTVFELCTMQTRIESILELEGRYEFVSYLVDHGDSVEFEQPICLLKKLKG